MLPSLHGLSLDRKRKPVPTAASERPRPEWAQQLTAPADREELELELARRLANEASNRAEVLERQVHAMEESGPRASAVVRKLQVARERLAACTERNRKLSRNFVRVQNELQELQARMDGAQKLLNEQGALLQEAEEQEDFMLTQRVAAQIRLAQCEEALAKVLRELSRSNDSDDNDDHESLPPLEENDDDDDDDDHESLPSLEENDDDPDPDPESPPDPPNPPDPPDPALDEAPCPDRDRPPGDNPQPPCDQPAPAPALAPAPAPEPAPEPEGIVGTPIVVLESKKEPLVVTPEHAEWAGKTMAELCKDTTPKQYLRCLLWICQAPHPLLTEAQLKQLAQLVYIPHNHEDVNTRLKKIISANQLKRMKLYRVWPKGALPPEPPAAEVVVPAAEVVVPAELVSAEVLPANEAASSGTEPPEPSWSTQDPWQKRKNQESFMDNLTKDWAYSWELESNQSAYFTEALEKIEREVEALASDMERLSEVPVLLRVAEAYLRFFVPNTFRPTAFWSTEVAAQARLAFFYEAYKPEWADAFIKFAHVCYDLAEQVFKKHLRELDKPKQKKGLRRADAKIYNILQVAVHKLYGDMADVSILAFVVDEMKGAEDDTKAMMLSRALPVWHRIVAAQLQGIDVTKSIPDGSVLRSVSRPFHEAFVALNGAMIAFDDAVGAAESEAVRDLFTLFSEDYEEHRWIKDVRKRVRDVMPYAFDSGAYDRRVKS